MMRLTPNPEAYPRLRLWLERWWLSHRPTHLWRWFFAGFVAWLLFVIIGLPFMLPLGGPKTVHPSTLADPNGAFVQIEGESLYYVHEPGDGETVILIHGFGGSTVTWQATIPALKDAGYNVFALDLRGFGLSEKGLDGDYSHPAQAERIVRFMDVMGIEQAHLVGHSMGGNVVTHVALSHPDRVSKLVLVDAAIVTQDARSIPDLVFEIPFARRWAQIVMRRLVDTVSKDMLYDAAGKDSQISNGVLEDYRRALYTPEWDLGLIGIMRDSDHNALPEPVSAIQAPTLILWGDSDTWVAPGYGANLEEMIPNARRVEFAGAGHLPMHEVPDEFNTVLLEFLGEPMP